MTPKQTGDIDEEKLGDELARVAAYPIDRWAEAVDKFKEEYLQPLLRISFQEGREAERKRAADILEACQKRIKQSEQVWSLQTYYEVQSELDGCKFDILTPPINEKNQ